MMPDRNQPPYAALILIASTFAGALVGMNIVEQEHEEARMVLTLVGSIFGWVVGALSLARTRPPGAS